MCSDFYFLVGQTENQALRLRSIPNWTASTLMNVIRRRQRWWREGRKDEWKFRTFRAKKTGEWKSRLVGKSVLRGDVVSSEMELRT